MPTIQTHTATSNAGHEALDTLRLMLMDEEITDASRVSAAKALLDRFLPKEDTEREQREADERAAAVAEAKCLMAEFAAAKSVGFYPSVALAEKRAPEPADAPAEHEPEPQNA
jgi:hypothetical protein